MEETIVFVFSIISQMLALSCKILLMLLGVDIDPPLLN